MQRFAFLMLLACGGESPTAPTRAPEGDDEPPSAASTTPSSEPTTEAAVTPGFALLTARPDTRSGTLSIIPGRPHAVVTTSTGAVLFDVPAGSVRWEFTSDAVNDVDFDASGTKMLMLTRAHPFFWSGEEDFSAPGRVHLVNLDTGETQTLFDDQEDYENRCLSNARLHPDGTHVALLRQQTSYDGRRVQGSLAVMRVGRAPRWRDSDLLGIRYTADGRMLVGFTEDAVVVLDPRRGRETARIALPGVDALELHPRDAVALAFTSGEIVSIDLGEATVRARASLANSSSYTAVWSPTGERVGVCARDGAHVFDAESLEPEEVDLPCRTGLDLRGRTAAFGPEGWADTEGHRIELEGWSYAAGDPERPTWTLHNGDDGLSILNHERNRARRLLRPGRTHAQRIRGVEIGDRMLLVYASSPLRFGRAPTEPTFPRAPFDPTPELTLVSGNRRLQMHADGDSEPRAVLQLAGASDPVALDVSSLEIDCTHFDGMTCYAVTKIHAGGVLVGDERRTLAFDDEGTRTGRHMGSARFVPDETGTRFAIVSDNHAVHLAGPDLRPGTRWLAPREGVVRVRFAPGRGPVAVTRGASLVLANAAGEVQYRIVLPHVPIDDPVFETADRVRIHTEHALVWVSVESGSIERTLEMDAVAVTPDGTHALQCEDRSLTLRDLSSDDPGMELGGCPYSTWPAGGNDQTLWWAYHGGLELVRVRDGMRLHVRAFQSPEVAVAYDDRGRVQLTDPTRVGLFRTRTAGPVFDATLSGLEAESLDDELVTRFLRRE